MHDVASAHSSRAVRDVLSNTYRDRWIGRREPTAWPPRSPDLNPLDIYLRGRRIPMYMLLLLTAKRHFTIALWILVRLSSATLASSNG
jgi:hypothetical protein